MDPSTCVKPTFKIPEPSRESTVSEIPDDVSDSLQKAAMRLKKEMEDIEPPHPLIEVKGEVGQCIVVKECKENDKVYLVICKNVEEPLFKVEKSVFRHVQFSSLTDCRVFVFAKMVRVFFMRCRGCQFSIRTPLIGPLEFFKCKSSKVNIRIKEEVSGYPIPLVMVEDCQNFDIYQSNKELIYVITLCIDISGNIVDPKTNERKKRYPLGKIFWEEQERLLVLLSQDKGFASASDRYNLNGIGQNLIIRPLGDEDNEPERVIDLFGTTP